MLFLDRLGWAEVVVYMCVSQPMDATNIVSVAINGVT
jgi:hypothetical protein